MLNNINSNTNELSPFFSPSIPDITPYCYGTKNITEIIDRFLINYENFESDDFYKFKNLLLQYKNLLFLEQRSSSTNIVNELFELVTIKFKDTAFEIFSRRKSFCKVCSKAYLFSKDLTFDINNIKDMNGFRIVLYSDSLDLCYDVMNNVIKFFVENKGHTLLPAEPLIHTKKFCLSNFFDVFIPKESGILTEYKFGVKDYVKFPKEETAYQSLHAVFLDSITSQKIEIQVRTIPMHKRAILDHTIYKKSRYGDEFDFFSWIDFSQISLNGFLANEDGEILQDSQGFIKSLILSNKYRFY